MRPHPEITLSMGNKKRALREGVAAKEEEEWRDWSSLTEPLLLYIISLFTTLQDFFAFRGVSRCWRSAAIPNRQTMSSQSPLILFYRRSGYFETPTRSLLDVVCSRHYLILPPYGDIFGYSHGHLIMHVMKNKSWRFILIDLYTGTQTLWLPIRRGLGKPYRFRLSSSPSSPGCLAILQPRKHEAFHYCHINQKYIGEWKQWAKNDVEDTLFLNNMLYVLTKSKELWVLDPLSKPWDLVLLEATSPDVVQETCSKCNMYLAESDGKLLMVDVHKDSHHRGFTDCFIWRWSFESAGGWVVVSCLGPRSLFIDLRGFVGSVPIPKRSCLRQNCIYFLKSELDCSLYSLGEGRFRDLPLDLPCYLDWKVDSPLWILPNVI